MIKKLSIFSCYRNLLFFETYSSHPSRLKSLINWVKKWEADGVTKIDGIGTQMHISYYENSGTRNSKKNAITNMFKLMAATG